jgi:hypothetical protein
MTKLSNRLLKFGDEGSGSGLQGPVKAEIEIVPALLLVLQHKPATTIDSRTSRSFFESETRDSRRDRADTIPGCVPKMSRLNAAAHAEMLSFGPGLKAAEKSSRIVIAPAIAS